MNSYLRQVRTHSDDLLTSLRELTWPVMRLVDEIVVVNDAQIAMR